MHKLFTLDFAHKGFWAVSAKSCCIYPPCHQLLDRVIFPEQGFSLFSKSTRSQPINKTTLKVLVWNWLLWKAKNVVLTPFFQKLKWFALNFTVFGYNFLQTKRNCRTNPIGVNDWVLGGIKFGSQMIWDES